jgi:hypothetical protein
MPYIENRTMHITSLMQDDIIEIGGHFCSLLTDAIIGSKTTVIDSISLGDQLCVVTLTVPNQFQIMTYKLDQ